MMIIKMGKKRNPSCTVLLQDRGNLKEGFVRCFACGYKASFPQFISTCFNVEDNGDFGEQWLEGIIQTFHCLMG